MSRQSAGGSPQHGSALKNAATSQPTLETELSLSPATWSTTATAVHRGHANPDGQPHHIINMYDAHPPGSSTHGGTVGTATHASLPISTIPTLQQSGSSGSGFGPGSRGLSHGHPSDGSFSSAPSLKHQGSGSESVMRRFQDQPPAGAEALRRWREQHLMMVGLPLTSIIVLMLYLVTNEPVLFVPQLLSAAMSVATSLVFFQESLTRPVQVRLTRLLTMSATFLDGLTLVMLVVGLTLVPFHTPCGVMGITWGNWGCFTLVGALFSIPVFIHGAISYKVFMVSCAAELVVHPVTSGLVRV